MELSVHAAKTMKPWHRKAVFHFSPYCNVVATCQSPPAPLPQQLHKHPPYVGSDPGR